MNRDIEEVVLACAACGGSGLQAMGCNLFSCPECDGKGISESVSSEIEEAENSGAADRLCGRSLETNKNGG
jgi:hypothetical protein